MPTYKHPRPYVAVDCVAFCYMPSTKKEPLGSLRILLKYRDSEGKWSLPGRFLICDSSDREGNDRGEYGDRAETIAQTFRRALDMELSVTIFNSSKTKYLSPYYNPEIEMEGLRSDADFNSDEFVMQLPLRSKVDRDKDRQVPVKDMNGVEKKDDDGNVIKEHPNYHVISVPILTMIKPKEPECRKEPGDRDYSQWIPLDWILEDNMIDDNGNEIKEVTRLFVPESNERALLKKYPRNPNLPIKYRLAFDHAEIVASAVRALRNTVRSSPIGAQLLPEKFKLSDLNRIYDEIVGYRIEPSNFRKSMMERGKPREAKKGECEDKSYIEKNLVIATDETDTDTTRRSATLVKFNKKVYQEYVDKLDFNFAL